MFYSIVGGIICAFPFLFYQIWTFVKPALKNNEMHASKGIIFYTSFLFFLGVAFGYFIISPLCVQFAGTFQLSSKIVNLPSISSFMSMIVMTTFYTGLLFELPVMVFLLTKIGVVSPAFLRKFRKHSIVVILILSAIITPPDVISQIIVAVPILILYEISILISARVEKNKLKKANV
jgi:sec-independent protein translocase protein TatC